MKAKRIIALTLSAAMAASLASVLTACKPSDKPNPTPPAPPYVEDTNSYYAVGQGLGEDSTLYNQGGGGWTPTSDDILFEKDTTVTDENVYTLSMKMYAGDAFKILFDKEAGWSGVALNFFILESEYIEGDGKDATYTVDGATWFVTNGDSNIICNEGQDGVYKFTLKTYPEAETQYVLQVTKEQSIPKLRVPYKMEVLGDINDFGWGAAINMTRNETVWSAVIDVKADDLVRNADGTLAEQTAAEEEVTPEPTPAQKYAAVYVANTGDGETDGDVMNFADLTNADILTADIIAGGETVKVNLLTEGKYTVTFDQTTKVATVSQIKDDWYIVAGTNEVKLTANTDGTWEGRITLEADATGVKLVNKGNGDAEVSVGDLTATTYVVKYDPAASENALRYEEADSYYFTGGFSTPAWGDGPKGNAIKLEKTGEGVYSKTVTFEEAVSGKLVKGNFLDGATDWCNNVEGNGSDISIAAGTVIITFENNVITVTPVTE